MQPITVFHRSVQNLVVRRDELRRQIDQNESPSVQRYEENLLLWHQIDEIDRQIGVAYYWHQATASEMGEGR